MNLLMDSFWFGFVFGGMTGLIFGMFLVGLLRHASDKTSDAELRLYHHVRETDLDEFEEKMK